MNDGYIYFAKCIEKAIIPSKREEDSGYDFYGCFDKAVIIKPGDVILVPTGICSAFSSNLVLLVKERGSTGSIGLATRMGVIDSGYRGQIKIGLNNTSNKTIILDPLAEEISISVNSITYPIKKAIAQGVFCEIPTIKAKEITYEELLKMESVRGESYLGASQK